ncbi:DUF5709 domain-containing protein [Cryptosporangium aurantiacum]|uniref:DUF5709 domain-containing protein n=1 Tax=Cryptosporangium aurantiacum TaxID=134849 RepID=A0A1M7MRS1_9ACTN|nr:DUF5709 domain-containing protein [Cryptosporangium aurantiacum]SHM93768.1 hypothetical protein SAMN05443668_102238 [Cryptosporangium aurantiacum]
MSETRPDIDGVEDDGVLDPADSLDSDDLRSDVLDRGVDAGDRYRASDRFGTTAAEQARGESLDQLLAEEEPDVSADFDDEDEDAPADLGSSPQQRAGRLVEPDEGAHEDEDAEAYAIDAGIDGAGASAEEAAIHLVDDER